MTPAKASTLETLIEQLRTAGFRITAARKATLQLLVDRNCCSLSVPEILDALGKKGVKPNVSTLYRELQFLTEQGITHEVIFKDGVTRYELQQSHHHHLVCNSCRSIEPIEVEQHLNSVEKSIQQKKRFRIESHSLEFYGLCESCH